MKPVLQIALAAGAALSFAALTPDAAPAAPGDIATAVADPGRPQADRDLDAARKPGEVMRAIGLHAGETVVDVWPGAYWDRLFADVVGPGGKVYALHLVEADKAEHVATPANGSSPFADHPNIVALVGPVNGFTVPEKADVVWIRQNYHDLYDPFMGPADVPAFNKAVFTALKPGGLYVVIDHAAPDGSLLAATNTTHRIDGGVVKKDLAAAGFVFVKESEALRNPADPRTRLVFDPSIKGHTDQFIYIYRKP